jgi:hypothetical protein
VLKEQREQQDNRKNGIMSQHQAIKQQGSLFKEQREQHDNRKMALCHSIRGAICKGK